MTKLNGIGALILVSICAALIAKYLYPVMTPVLNQDSYQYISVADNALNGKVGYTSIVHFDTERSLEKMPAPLVTFPAGYPLAMALVSLIGVSTQMAGLVVSVVATLACLPLLVWIGARIGFSRPLNYVLATLFATNATVVFMGASVMTEALFTLLILAGVACLVEAKIRGPQGSAWYWVLMGLSFAVAYLTRYAGMFFIIGLVALVVYYAVTTNRTMVKGIFIALLISGGTVLAGAARNIYLVGNWRGGNDKVVSNPFLQTVVKAIKGMNALILGPGSVSEGGTTVPRLICVLLFIGGIAFLSIRHLRRSTAEIRVETPARSTSIGPEMAILSSVYMVCLFYAGLKSVIDYGDPRYFLPMAPPLLLLVGGGIRRWSAAPPRQHDIVMRTAGLTLLSAAVVLCIGLNLLALRFPKEVAASALESDFVASKVGEAQFSAKIRDLLGPDGVAVSNNGQPVAHLIARPTISLVGPAYSNVEWTERATRNIAIQYRARAIVIYIPEAWQWNDGDYIPSTFIRQLAEVQPPNWMKLEFRSKRLLVYTPSAPDGSGWAADK